MGNCQSRLPSRGPSDRELKRYRHARRRAVGVPGPEMRRRRQQAVDDFAAWQMSRKSGTNRKSGENRLQSRETRIDSEECY